MASVVGICNSALSKLGALRIASLSDSSKNARACNDAYERVRDATLRKHGWNFAIARAELAADATAPDFGPAYQYPLPSDCLRVLPPNDYDLEWVIEGRNILTDWTAPLEVRYIKRVTDPNEMDPLFREVLACELALDLCEQITQSNTKKAGIKEDRKEMLAEARRTNAIEQTAQELPEDDWITARE